MLTLNTQSHVTILSVISEREQIGIVPLPKSVQAEVRSLMTDCQSLGFLVVYCLLLDPLRECMTNGLVD